MIRLEQLSKVFEPKKSLFAYLNSRNTIPTVKAVDNVSLHIPKGQIFGIIGFSGAGKSTLVRLINCLERPTSGQVYVNDHELTSLNNSQLRLARREIGMIFQSFCLMKLRNVRDNIAYPLEIAGWKKADIDSRVMELLQLVGLVDKERAYPDQLSGGQKQRVAIARAIANRPGVLLCDEATSALDPETTRSILNLLQTINQKEDITMVIITHEMNVVRQICHQVAVMSDGQVVEKGFVDKVFNNPTDPTTQRLLGLFHEGDNPNFQDDGFYLRAANQKGVTSFEPG